MKAILLTVFLLVLCCPLSAHSEDAPEANMELAKVSFNEGKMAQALEFAGKAVEAKPKSTAVYVLRAEIYSRMRKHAESLADWNEAFNLSQNDARIQQHRGCEHFRAGNFKQSIADFDAFIKAYPDQAPYHWQRGISCYYDGQFAEGRKQFELHKTVNPDDVENAAWHFLCVARLEGVEKARAALIEVKGDARVPMKEIFELFKGTAKPADVIEAAKTGEPSPERLKEQLFYAHLYLGLYAEAVGDSAAVRENIQKAETLAGDDYMGDVARVHAKVLKQKESR